jgi:hypothetical protein
MMIFRNVHTAKDTWLIFDMKVFCVWKQRERNYAGDRISKETVFFEL